MFSSFCEKLLLKMGKSFQGISRKPSCVHTDVNGWVRLMRASAYRMGGLVKNVMILSVCTLWMAPHPTLVEV